MNIIKNIKRKLTFWHRIDEPPEWVEKAHYRWKGRLRTHPYNMRKHFIGRNNIYRVQHGIGGQGQAPIIGWYIKKRIR